MSGITPSQTIGPFFHYALTTEKTRMTDLLAGGARGEAIVLSGRVRDGEGAPVPDAMIEIWQANAAGRYNHAEDTREEAALDPAFSGFGRAQSDADGAFAFRTLKPGPVPGPGNRLQAPHILVSVFARGLLTRLVTRVYFAGEDLNENDPVLETIADPARRATLLAERDGQGGYRWDIVLQGASETVFFEA